MIYKKDTHIEILATYSANWVKIGNIYIIDKDYNDEQDMIYLRTLEGKIIESWACCYGKGFKVVYNPFPHYEVY